MGAIVVQAARIDDADAGEGQSLLVLQTGNLLGRAQRQWMLATVQKIGVEQGRPHPPPAPVHRPCRACRRFPLPPSAPASTGRANRCAPRCTSMPRCCGLARRWRGHGLGAQRQRAGIARYVNRDTHARPPRVQPGVEAFGRQPALQFVIDQHRRRAGAVAQAIHRLQRERAIGSGLVEVDAQPLLDMCFQRRRAHRLARLGPAQVDHLRPGRWRCGSSDRSSPRRARRRATDSARGRSAQRRLRHVARAPPAPRAAPAAGRPGRSLQPCSDRPAPPRGHPARRSAQCSVVAFTARFIVSPSSSAQNSAAAFASAIYNPIRNGMPTASHASTPHGAEAAPRGGARRRAETRCVVLQRAFVRQFVVGHEVRVLDRLDQRVADQAEQQQDRHDVERAVVDQVLATPASSWVWRMAAISNGPMMPAADQAVSRRPWIAPTICVPKISAR